MKENKIFKEIKDKNGEVIGFATNDGSLDYGIEQDRSNRIENSGVTMFGIYPDAGGNFPSGAGVRKPEGNGLENSHDVITGSNDYPGQKDLPISSVKGAREGGVKRLGIYFDGDSGTPLREGKVSEIPTKGY